MSKNVKSKNETANGTKPVLGDVLQVGNFIEFKGMSMKIYGYICRINNDDSVDYVRDSLTRWNASTAMVERGNLISEDDFISRVKHNADMSGAKIPSTDEALTVLGLFKSNFDVDLTEIHKALNIA
jgi:hypothetical protein